jgi:hypothetical protein
MEGSEGHDGTTGRRSVEGVLFLFVVVGGPAVPGHVLAKGVEPLGPSVGKDEPFRVGEAHALDAEEVPHLSFRPQGGGNEGGDAVHLRGIAGDVAEDAEEQVLTIEGEVVGHEEAVRDMPMVMTYRASRSRNTKAQMARRHSGFT